MAALLLGLGAAVLFVVLVGGLVFLLAPFAGQIVDDHVRATERQRQRLRLTEAGRTVRS